MLDIASQIILCLIITSILGFILGFLVSKYINKPIQVIKVKETIVDETPTFKKPLFITEPKDGLADDLTQIKGIGPKLSNNLNNLGIYHIEQIANWSDENIHWLDENTTFTNRIKRDAWIEQAQLLI